MRYNANPCRTHVLNRLHSLGQRRANALARGHPESTVVAIAHYRPRASLAAMLAAGSTPHALHAFDPGRVLSSDLRAFRVERGKGHPCSMPCSGKPGGPGGATRARRASSRLFASSLQDLGAVMSMAASPRPVGSEGAA